MSRPGRDRGTTPTVARTRRALREIADDFEAGAAAVLVNAGHTAVLLRSAARLAREFKADFEADVDRATRGDGEERKG